MRQRLVQKGLDLGHLASVGCMYSSAASSRTLAPAGG